MFATIIPYIRTIRGVNVFDYAVPEDMNCTVGDMVFVPFRSKKVAGVIIELHTSSTQKNVKSIDSLAGESLSQKEIDFLHWFSEYYFVSLPTALKTLYRKPLKRPRAVSDEQIQWSGQHETLPDLPESVGRSITTALRSLRSEETSAVYYSQRADCLALYNRFVHQAEHLVRIIVPEQQNIDEIAAALPADVPICVFTNDVSDSEYRSIRQWCETHTTGVLIGTKNASLLSVEYFGHTIIDQEHARSHKQYDLNPRYHVRDVIFAQQRSIQEKNTEAESAQHRVVSTTYAPSMELAYRCASKEVSLHDISRQWTAQHITTVDMNNETHGGNFSWFSEPLRSAIHGSHRTLLFLNRTGQYSVLQCRSCSTIVNPSVQPATCTECGSVDFQQKRKGVQQLEQELREEFPHRKIVLVDSAHEATVTAIESADIVIATERIFRVVPLDIFEYIGILSVDHLLVFPHFRSHERVFQLLTQLFISSVPVILQTYAPEHPVIRAAIQRDIQGFVSSELAVRTMLQLPPVVDIFQTIEPKTRKRSGFVSSIDAATLGATTVVDRV